MEVQNPSDSENFGDFPQEFLELNALFGVFFCILSSFFQGFEILINLMSKYRVCRRFWFLGPNSQFIIGEKKSRKCSIVQVQFEAEINFGGGGGGFFQETVEISWKKVQKNSRLLGKKIKIISETPLILGKKLKKCS